MFSCKHLCTKDIIFGVIVAVSMVIVFLSVPFLQQLPFIASAIFLYFGGFMILACVRNPGLLPSGSFSTSSKEEEETTSDPPKYEDAVAQEIFGTVSQTTLSLEGGQNDVLNSDISFAYPEPPPPYHESVTTPLVDNEEDSGTM